MTDERVSELEEHRIDLTGLEIEEAILKAHLDYTKEEVDNKFTTIEVEKADKSTTFTKEEVDNKFTLIPKLLNTTDAGYIEYKVKSKNFEFGNTPNTFYEKANVKLINNELFASLGQNIVLPTMLDAIQVDNMTTTKAYNKAVVVIDNTTDDIYQAIQSVPLGTSLTNNLYFQTKTNLALQDIVTNRQHKTTKVTDIYTYRSINVWGTWNDYSNNDIMIGEGFSLVSGMKDTYEDSEYYYSLIGFVPRLNGGVYHPVLNEYGTNYSTFLNGGGQAFWYHSGLINVYINICDCFTIAPGTIGGNISSTFSARPDGKFYDKTYETGLNGLVDRRISADNLTEEQMIRMSDSILKENRDGYGIELIVIDTIVTSLTNTTDLDFSKTDSLSVGDVINLQLLETNTSKIYKDLTITYISHGTYISINKSINRIAGSTLVVTKSSNQCVQGEQLSIEVIGNPDNYPQLWKDRLTESKSLPFHPLLISDIGENLIPDGTNKSFKMGCKVIDDLGYVYSTDEGLNWNYFNDLPIINTTNSTAAVSWSENIAMFNYISDIDPIKKFTPLLTSYVDPKVFVSNDNNITKFADFTRVITGVTPTGDNNNSTEQRTLENIVPKGTYSHSVITLNTDTTSAAKWYRTITEKDNQILLQVHGEILESDGTDVGDNGKFDGINLNNVNDNTKILSAVLPFRSK